jgi:RNase H-like domain found in reverse transcriptase/Reverse transcriptase (RNA-dependent DNA polymerase)/Integrase zinc binding domain/Integrase core domain
MGSSFSPTALLRNLSRAFKELWLAGRITLERIAASKFIGKIPQLHNRLNHIPFIATIIRQVCCASVPLQFVEFRNNNRHFLALLDSGAQLNVINTLLLRKLQHKPTNSHPMFNSLQGVQGKASLIHQWVDIRLCLSNGHEEIATFAAIDDLPNGIILGLPFLVQTRATVDYSNKILTTRHGPICLTSPTQQPHKTHAFAHNVSVALEIENPNMEPEIVSNLKEILNNHDQLWHEGRRGATTQALHAINLSNHIPINCKPRRHTPEEQKVIDQEVDKMLKDEVIRPSISPYASEVVLVKKSSGSWRVCIDYRRLNAVTIRDRYPLPRIPDLLCRVQNSKFFIALDLRAGYWQIPMHPDSIKYTAFRCFRGLFEFVVMPFGLTNAPATFQRLMNSMFSDLYFQGVVVYLDDILVHGDTPAKTLNILQEVLQRLAQARLTINLEKCRFFPVRLNYLGHVIEAGRMFPNPERVEALHHIVKPKTVHDIRVLLGTIGYYQQYIENYSRLLVPVFELLKATTNTKRRNKLTPVVWTEEHQKAVDLAIYALAHSTLTIPLDTSEFLLETDASDQAVGAILSCLQENGNWAPVEFASKKLTETQRRWPTREKEAFAIIFGLQKFEHFLRGRAFKVHTDHESLQWMLDSKGGKIARWASRLSEFNMKIYYKKGTEMSHIDFMSRYIDFEQDDDLQERMVYTVEGTKTLTLPTIKEVLEAQQQCLPPVGRGYFLRDGHWYFRNGLWVPTQLRTRILAACHSVSPHCHPGEKKTKRMICRVFNWPNLHQDITRYIKGCLICQQCRPGLERLQGLFRMHPVPGPFQTVYMDYWSCHYDEPCTVLTMIDQFTKWAEAIPIPNKSESVVTSAFLRSWICRFGVPRTIITDNDKTFMGGMFQRVAAQLGIKALLIDP